VEKIDFELFLFFIKKLFIVHEYSFKIANNIARIKQNILVGACLNHSFNLDDAKKDIMV